jgi:hypothetical protein
MSQGNDFNYSAATDSDTGTAGSEEVWFVAVASDDIKQMNVDQLDEAFRLGIVTEDTAVWTEGMEAWQPLGQVLGNDASEGESAAREHAASAHSSSQHGVTPHSGVSQISVPASSASAPSASASSASAYNGGFGAVTLQSVQHSYAPGPLSVAPVTSSLAPSSHTAHGLGQSPSYGLGGPASLSMDDDVPAAPPARRFRPERWALAAAAVVAVGAAVYNNFSSSVASAGTAAPAPTALAARPYDGVEKGSTPEDKGAEEGTTQPAKAAEADDSPVGAATKGVAAAMATASAAAVASDDTEPPASAKKGADKDSLKGSFSKAFNGNKKSTTARAAKVKPRKAASRATKSRAKAKKPSVARSQSAFDPLNDSLP